MANLSSNMDKKEQCFSLAAILVAASNQDDDGLTNVRFSTLGTLRYLRVLSTDTLFQGYLTTEA